MKEFCLSSGGLLTDKIRRKIWPILLNVEDIEEDKIEIKSEEELISHRDYGQVIYSVHLFLYIFSIFFN